MDEEFDVFISHKQEDLSIAERLATKIVALGYTCYLDARDKKLGEAKAAADAAQAIPLHLRKILRKCRALIFVSSSNSPLSRWMPWETGFFDGRYDQSAVGIYLTDEIPKKTAVRNGTISKIQEYLNLYQALNDNDLEDFLARTSNRKKMNVREGQIDQLMLAIRTATENPREFSLGCLQWSVGFWRSIIAQNYGETLANAWLPMLEDTLGRLRENAAAEDFAAQIQQRIYGAPMAPFKFEFLDMFKNAQERAADVSRAIQQHHYLQK